MKRLQNLSDGWKLGAILAVFSALVLGNISRWSIWFDEAFTAYITRFNFAEIYQFTSVDVHPPLFYWVVKLWSLCFGTSELAFRSLSLVFALIGLIGLYMIIKKLFTSKHALAVVGLASLTPLLIRFSEEARMYTMVFAIVMWATYLLVLQMQTKPKTWRWVVYGLLIAAGMWVHYYVALAWLAHWVWRYIELRAKSKRNLTKRFFSKQWVWTHFLAVGVFLPWLPYAVTHFLTVQVGFWIPKFGIYTPIDYLSNGLIYQQYGQLLGWPAVLFLATSIAVAVVIYRARKLIPRASRAGYRLLAVMAIIPPVLLMMMSMPPLTPSFIDRYVMYSLLFLVALIVISMMYAYKKSPRLVSVSFALLLATMSVGIFNVYYYGNYNKNTSTSIRAKETTQLIDEQGASGQPIIASSPWLYYEAAAYDTSQHHVYFIDANTEYKFGSLAMLEERNMGKIKDLKDFAKRHKQVWYMTTSDEEVVEPPVDSWKEIKRVSAYDYINDSATYRATLFNTSGAN